MPVIKRYPNRKLYDTESKGYITLDGIAQLIREGEEVQVIDNVTGEDLTAVTLTQVIFEQEKKEGGALPLSVLTGLIRTGGNKLDTLRRTITSPLDTLRHVDAEIERRVQDLVSRGELARDEGSRLREKLLSLSRNHEGSWLDEAELQEALQRQGVPSRDELQAIMKQLDELTAKLEKLQETNN